VPGLELLIVTGMSGAGKSQASKCLEDLGVFCVDNLPAPLIPKFAELCAQSQGAISRAALVVDVREGELLSGLLDILGELRRGGSGVRVLFLDASDEVLLRRFSETRRPHPLAPHGSVAEGIRLERGRLGTLRETADLILDTSGLTVHELRKILTGAFRALPEAGRTTLAIVSFGYKFGLPGDADLVFDVRFLPNPHFEPGLRPLTGLDPAVAAFLDRSPVTKQTIDRLADLLAFCIPLYVQEGKAYLTLGVGCTGGRHRSVTVAEALAQRVREAGHAVTVRHRDLDKPAA
jgi:UPF0042 nucleotide-binding protein